MSSAAPLVMRALGTLPWLAAVALVCSRAEAVTIDVPAAYTNKCSGCHGVPPGTGSKPMTSFGDDARLASAGSLINFLNTFESPPGTKPMNGLVTDLGEANLLRLYLLNLRDGRVLLDNAQISTGSTSSYSFPTGVTSGSSSAETAVIRIANARGTALNSVQLQGTFTHFSVVSNTCTASPAIAAVTSAGTNAGECQIGVKFSPSEATAKDAVLTSVFTLSLTFASGHLPTTVTYPIQFSGTSNGPAVVLAPVFTPSGFGALTSFSATSAGSQTLCPTIQNTGTANLSLSFSAGQAAGSSSDGSSYFELGDIAACPSGPRVCVTSLPPGSSISGGTTLQVGGDSSCTLPVRFNPAKFGAAGGTGARSATLRVTHNAAGSPAEFLMSGVVSAVPEPRIGVFTNPGEVKGSVSPPAFAAQTVGSSSVQWSEFFIFNTGSADGLDITAVTQTNGSEFALTENCVSAPPLARTTTGTGSPRCTIGLRFTPTATGQRCTAVTVRAAVSSNAAPTINICGTGVAVPVPALTLSRASIDFGQRAINAAYPAEPLVIGNAAGASASLQISAVTVIGDAFTLLPGATCSGTSVAAGSTCTVQVQFNPDRPDATYSASLQIDTNDPATPRRTVSLTGAAGGVVAPPAPPAPPVLQFIGAPAQLEFAGFVVAGQQSDQVLTLTLRNAGPGNAALQTIRMIGADASSFSVDGCPQVLAEGGSCVISLRFVPGSGGLKQAQLEIISSQSVTPALLTVIGQGIGSSSAFITASASSLSLGTIRVGAQSVPTELRLASAGDGVVLVTAMEAGAPFSVQSKTCPSVPFTLPPGGDCTVTVTFTPTDAGPSNAMLRISTDADSQALDVSLTANGEAKADLSSGGCSMVSGDSAADPTLWVLVLLAIAGLLHRQRSRVAERRRQ